MRVTLRLDGNAVRREALRQVLAQIRERQQDLRPCYPEVLPVVYAHEEQLFRQEGETLDAPRWEELSDGYRAWKERHAPGKPILQLTEKLRQQVTGEGGLQVLRQPHWLLLATDLPLHWSGGSDDLGGLHMSGRKAGKVSPMPARPPIRTTDAEAMDIADVVADYLTDSRIVR